MVVIVISGMPGCGNSTLGRTLAKKLKLRFFSLGKYRKSLAAKWTGKKLKETEQSIVVWKMKKGRNAAQIKSEDAYALKIAKKGNVVIDAKLGLTLLKGSYDLGVWVKAPLTVRAARYAKRDNISMAEAKKQLIFKQASERKNWKRVYGFDYFSQSKRADIVLDTSKKTPEQLANEVMKQLNKR